MALPSPLSELILYLMLYSFLGWAVQVCHIAVKKRRFVNHGFLNLPFELPYGVSAVLLILTLPTLERRYWLQFLLIWAVLCVVWKLSEQIIRGVIKGERTIIWQVETFSGKKGVLLSLVTAGIYLLGYLVVHPLVFTLVTLMPDVLTRILAISFSGLVLVDFISVILALRSNSPRKRAARRKESTQRLGDRLSDSIWRRLQKSYPGIREIENPTETYTFAKGISFDKLVWVFLVSSFLGDIIETLYVGLTAGKWMSRSSVLYGSFSFVWGFGAVLLTIVLQRVAEKDSFKAFLAGFFVGGAYEYLCSVFTEIVFGTVFWDYSNMPLNIGGRTNVLYCFFWGLLAVVWIKGVYPIMSRCIEKIPPLIGKILTWVVVFVMVCNGLLTSGAMVRYSLRQEDPQPRTAIEEFLDERYDDEWMENRWPNMRITEP